MGDRVYTKEEEDLEIQSLRRIISAYLNYPDAAEKDVRRYERSFKKLPPPHKALLSHLPLKFQRIRWCISMNTSFIMNMLQAFEPPFDMIEDIEPDHVHTTENTHEHSHSDISPIGERRNISISLGDSSDFPNKSHKLEAPSLDKEETHAECSLRSTMHRCAVQNCDDKLCNGDEKASCDWKCHASMFSVSLVDVDKVRCIIRNIVRDWAQEGQRERDECYKPILEEINRLFPDRTRGRPPSCLVPGAGLGRLALEISSLGFVSQGNEFSYYMMICSSFILNNTREANEWTIYPWIHSNCNSLSTDDQLRPVSFPDIHPASAGITEGFSMCGGDFVEVYNDRSQEGSWDAVVTCFFLDTAHNIVEYIEIIAKILKVGGVWINLGPLLYHFADSYGEDEMSIELSLEDVKKVAFYYGFELEVEKMIETTYTANTRSMMQTRYTAAYWTMKKKNHGSKAVHTDK
ncbi:hypothetical protein LUZ63_006846 [Rhynchospora breviuscula]|uniref:carnosine N-methyltransferase n=1 Tax=Rhynchospora breviuscula TaxID=2022672 RepID=A0A9Q0CQJ1_9POAL|nr:hypothetical protein LUZ63_006846 [Rhynchospora breviuscula]